MSNPTQSIDFVLRQEDSTLSGIITNEANDAGGLTRFGLCAKWHPELVAAGFYQVAMDTATALNEAEVAYANAYATPLLLIGLFAFAYFHNPDDELTGSLIAAFSGAWGYYLGSSQGAKDAGDRASKATDALASAVGPVEPPSAP